MALDYIESGDDKFSRGRDEIIWTAPSILL